MVKFTVLRAASLYLIAIVLLFWLVACKAYSNDSNQSENRMQGTQIFNTVQRTVVSHLPESTVIPKIDAPASATPKQTSTPSPEPSVTPSPTATPTATPIGLCQNRIPTEGLFTLVTLRYGISRDYVPTDLVDLSDYLPQSVTLGYPSEIRQEVIFPLVHMIQDMIEAGLEPQIVSGYRSYSAQVIARNRWLEEYPDRAAIVSAPPGHSEHQLGTAIDFGSPELVDIVGDDAIRFHTDFYRTREGQWLEQNAHGYGFTLSFSRNSFELAGLYYEPWHFRYVGPEVATFLKDNDITLIQYLLELHGPPCIPL